MAHDPFAEFKARQKPGWALFTAFEMFSTPVGAATVRAAGVKPGQAALDIGTGTGIAAITAARAGATATGLDMTPELLARAKENAAIAKVEDRVTWKEGDAEALPFPDASFDVVMSQFGHMFAPRPEVATREMLRVLRPGGALAFATWPPAGFIGEMFQLVGRHAPPPPEGAQPPWLWGDEKVVRERLGSAVKDLRFERVQLPFPALSPGHVRAFYEQHAGPVVGIVRGLAGEAARLAQFRKEFEALVERHARDNVIPMEAMLTRATKA